MQGLQRFTVGIAFFAAISFLSLPFASAYEEAPVSGGGTISGKISFKGTPPPPKLFEFAKFPNPKYCSQADSDGKGHRILHEVNVKNGALADVVVYLEGVEKGKPFKFEDANVKANLCRFLAEDGPSTLVGVVRNKKEIKVLNTDADPSDPKSADGVLHNPHGYEVKGAMNNTMFNKPLPTKGMVLKQKLIFRKHDSFMHMQCDQHNYMNVYFHPVDNPYYAIVGEDGKYSIDDVPPGNYEIYAWHPILGSNEEKITVAANGKATANFEFKP
jgi:Polysaccharide lyase family 4, domain II